MSLKQAVKNRLDDIKWFMKYWVRSTPGNILTDLKRRIISPYTLMGIGILITAIKQIPYSVPLGIIIFVLAAFYSEYSKYDWKAWKREQYTKRAKQEEARRRQESSSEQTTQR